MASFVAAYKLISFEVTRQLWYVGQKPGLKIYDSLTDSCNPCHRNELLEHARQLIRNRPASRLLPS